MNFEDLIRHHSQPLDAIPTALEASGSTRAPIRAILYDVYGTLLISKAGDISIAKQESSKNVAALTELFHRYGIEKHVQDVLKEFFGAIEADKQRRAEDGIDCPEVIIESIWASILGTDNRDTAQQFALEYELIVNPVYPMPHVAELIRGCAEAHLPIGIISNAQFFTPLLFSALLGGSLEELGFRHDLLFFSYLLGYGKPSTKVFEIAAETLARMGISKIEILFVGNDILKDIRPAMEVGFQTALFAGDRRSLDLRKDDTRCFGVKADVVVTDLLQILNLLDNTS